MKLDLKEWLAKVTGQTEFKTLLWTNPNSATAFASQTITIDISNYDAFEVEFRHWSNDETRIMVRAEKDAYNHMALCPTYTSASMSRRAFSANVGNGVWFGAGLNSTNAQDNSGAIPTKIWGIRYVGGVVRKLLKALKPLTLGRGWAV